MSAQIAVQSTPTPETVHATFGRDVRVRVAMHETADGGITLDLQILDADGQGLGLAALAFDFADHDLLDGLSLSGAQLRGQNVLARRVRPSDEATRGYDCGARFARSTPMGGPAPRQTALRVEHESLTITLDDLSGRDFALKLVPTAANHAACEGFVIEGRFPARPAAPAKRAAPADGSVFGGILNDILPLTRRAAALSDSAA